MFQKWKQQIAEICTRAINGSINLEEFYREWPGELHESDLAKGVYEDLEDGITHFPAKPFSGKPDYELWGASDMYRRLVIISEILKTNLSEPELIDIRHSLLSVSNLPIAEISSRISKLLTK